MNHINRIFASIAAIFVLAGLNSPVYASLVHYTYSGNTFAPIQIVNYPPFGPIYGYPQGSGNVHRLTIDFTLDDSLVPKNGTFAMSWTDTTAVSFPITSFLITDGGISVSNNSTSNLLGANTSINLLFDTDAQGNVSGRWDISAYHGSGGFRMYDYYLGSTYNNPPNANRDFASIITSAPGMAYLLESINSPGTWTRTTLGTPLVPVPLPGGILLFSSALLSGLCLIRRTRPSYIVTSSVQT